MNPEDQEFIRRLLDPVTKDEAFRSLISQYKRPLYAHIRSIVIDHDDADDALQNTFVKVFQHLGSFKGESRLFTWVYRIATNEALSFIRTKKRKTGIGTEADHERTLSNLKADIDYDGDEICELLFQAVAVLPEKQKLVFNMKYFQEMKYEDMSGILGTSVGALKASYHHAVKKIEDYVTRKQHG